MDTLIPISQLNDFIFCPYSIYLHNVYVDADEDLYHAVPQTRGRHSHESIDSKSYSTKKDDLQSISVYSEELGVMGKIDLFKKEEGFLIERKYQLKQIYQGQLYQLWAQCFCLLEMGYKVNKVAFYEISTNKMMVQETPTQKEKEELLLFIQKMKAYNPLDSLITNKNKCAHCIYSSLCDKTEDDNVYT